jgi:hypothetical protein
VFLYAGYLQSLPEFLLDKNIAKPRYLCITEVFFANAVKVTMQSLTEHKKMS